MLPAAVAYADLVVALGELAERLERAFPDFTLEVFAERHHFDPPHRVEPERLARALRATWERAGPGQP